MKVLIVGSIDQDSHRIEEFSNVCRDIGEALGAARHTVIVGSDGRHTADRYVVEGVNLADGSNDVIVYRPPKVIEGHDPGESPLPFHAEANTFPNVRFRYKHHHGSWTVSHAAGIRDADVAITIGGGYSTEVVGQVAPILGKPVLPIPLFDGAAEKTWGQLSGAYLRSGFSDAEVQSVSINWNQNSGRDVERMIKKISRNNPFQEKQSGWIFLLPLVPILCLALWTSMFILASRKLIAFDIAFFSLAFLGAILGASLRVVARELRGSQNHGDLRVLLIEVVAALILGFGFLLLYLIGGFIIVGSFEPVVNLTSADDFRRTAITTSALAMFVGFLLEDAIREFTKRGVEVLSPDR